MDNNILAKDLRSHVDLYYLNDEEQLAKLTACPSVPGPSGAYLVGQEIRIVETPKKSMGRIPVNDSIRMVEYAFDSNLPPLPEGSKIVAQIPLSQIIAIDSWKEYTKNVIVLGNGLVKDGKEAGEMGAKYLRINGELVRFPETKRKTKIRMN